MSALQNGENSETDKGLELVQPEDLTLQRQIDALEAQLNEAIKHPSDNGLAVRQLTEQLAALWAERDGLK